MSFHSWGQIIQEGGNGGAGGGSPSPPRLSHSFVLQTVTRAELDSSACARDEHIFSCSSRSVCVAKQFMKPI